MSSVYFPQAVVTLRLRLEDFKGANSTGSKIYKQTLIPKSARVNINNYREADKFSLVIDYKDFPFDPRAIRSLGITVHMEDRKKLYKDDGTLNFLIPTEENTIFVGFADEDNIEFSDTERTISLEGRDFTSLFIDSPYNGKALELNLTIDKLIENLVTSLPSTSNIKVVNKTGGTLPVLAKFAPDFNALSTKRAAKNKETIWDVIQDLSARAGLISYVSLDELILTKPQNLFDRNKHYKFVHGKNISKLNFKRKIGRQKGVNVRVRSLNINRKEVIQADIPREASFDWSRKTGVAQKDQVQEKLGSDGSVKKETAPFLTFFLPNISDKLLLIEIGESIWEQVGRQQLEGSLTTYDMATQQVRSQKTETLDLLQLRIGDAIKIEIDDQDMEGLQRFKSESSRSKYLVNRGYSRDIAAALAKSLGKFETRFYTDGVEYSVDHDTGFEMKVNFINFIETDQAGL